MKHAVADEYVEFDVGFYPTYEELKRPCPPGKIIPGSRFYPTYEELKLEPLDIDATPRKCFYPTYEELKLVI